MTGLSNKYVIWSDVSFDEYFDN